MTLKEERYAYFTIANVMIGDDYFGSMINDFRPKPKDNERFEFTHFGNDVSKSTAKTTYYFWVYKVYEK